MYLKKFLFTASHRVLRKVSMFHFMPEKGSVQVMGTGCETVKPLTFDIICGIATLYVHGLYHAVINNHHTVLQLHVHLKFFPDENSQTVFKAAIAN